MLKKVSLGIAAVLLFGVVVVAIGYHVILNKVGSDSALEDYALQDDSKVVAPVVKPVDVSPVTATEGEMNLYWGELHLHTAESFDSSMMGNKLVLKTLTV